jgi:hypothetical protein
MLYLVWLSATALAVRRANLPAAARVLLYCISCYCYCISCRSVCISCRLPDALGNAGLQASLPTPARGVDVAGHKGEKGSEGGASAWVSFYTSLYRCVLRKGNAVGPPQLTGRS